MDKIPEKLKQIPDGMDQSIPISFLPDDDIRLELLSLAYQNRIYNGWDLKQVAEELENLLNIYFDDIEF